MIVLESGEDTPVFYPATKALTSMEGLVKKVQALRNQGHGEQYALRDVLDGWVTQGSLHNYSVYGESLSLYMADFMWPGQLEEIVFRFVAYAAIRLRVGACSIGLLPAPEGVVTSKDLLIIKEALIELLKNKGFTVESSVPLQICLSGWAEQTIEPSLFFEKKKST